ncbi:Actin-like protein ARP6 [Durusdinium trenchii]|uniref:Actin-like protein ARP6 n=1 Tax=Durusdinium trenchii TaxID=1381693 RepID=A0ABP0JR79_9DINO
MAVLAVLAPLTPEVVVQEVVVMLEGLGFLECTCIESSCVALKSLGLGQALRSSRHPSPCCTVLQLGFSGLFAQPTIEGKAIGSAGRRSPVGGRVLTNLLLETLKLRHFDLRHAWLVVQDILEATCYVPMESDEAKREPSAVTYVLPDLRRGSRGFVAAAKEEKGEAQKLILGLERLMPEALFRPQDYGIPCAGVTELVVSAVRAVPEELWRPHLGRVVLCGGLARLEGLLPRLQRELRKELPEEWPVELLQEEEPEWSVWRGVVVSVWGNWVERMQPDLEGLKDIKLFNDRLTFHRNLGPCSKCSLAGFVLSRMSLPGAVQHALHAEGLWSNEGSGEIASAPAEEIVSSPDAPVPKPKADAPVPGPKAAAGPTLTRARTKRPQHGALPVPGVKMCEVRMAGLVTGGWSIESLQKLKMVPVWMVFGKRSTLGPPSCRIRLHVAPLHSKRSNGDVPNRSKMSEQCQSSDAPRVSFPMGSPTSARPHGLANSRLDSPSAVSTSGSGARQVRKTWTCRASAGSVQRGRKRAEIIVEGGGGHRRCSEGCPEVGGVWVFLWMCPTGDVGDSTDQDFLEFSEVSWSSPHANSRL